jgi:hypothetical protein
MLERMKFDAERQVAALRAQQFAVLEILPNGDSVDRTAQQIAALEQTIVNLDEAISVSRPPAPNTAHDR